MLNHGEETILRDKWNALNIKIRSAFRLTISVSEFSQSYFTSVKPHAEEHCVRFWLLHFTKDTVEVLLQQMLKRTSRLIKSAGEPSLQGKLKRLGFSVYKQKQLRGVKTVTLYILYKLCMVWRW